MAGTPLYHLTVLSVPDATAVTAKDINEAGQIVGTYSDQDFVRHAVLWDAQGWHELALPDGVEVNGIATAINNSGQIVGTSDDFVVPTIGLLWNAATPDQFTVLDETATVGVSPNDINDDGVVVGGFGVPSRAFVWTSADGLVDYGIQDPNVEDQQARWSAISVGEDHMHGDRPIHNVLVGNDKARRIDDEARGVRLHASGRLVRLRGSAHLPLGDVHDGSTRLPHDLCVADLHHAR